MLRRLFNSICFIKAWIRAEWSGAQDLIRILDIHKVLVSKNSKVLYANSDLYTNFDRLNFKFLETADKKN